MTQTASIFLSLSIALLAGLLLSRLAKLVKLPAVTAYLISGVLIGPFVLGALNNTDSGNIECTEHKRSDQNAGDQICGNCGEFHELGKS